MPVAAREIARARLPAERHLGDCGAVGEQRVEQADVLGRIDAVVSAGQHRDGAGREARAMRGRVDAARKPGGDDESGLAEFAREPLGEFHAGRRSVARADDSDHRRAPAPPRWPRTATSGGASSIARKPGRIAGFAERDEPRAERGRAASISRSASARGQMRAGRAAPPRRASSGRASSAARALPK